jgi:hypothetical protein
MGKTGGLFPPDQRDVRGQRGEGQIEVFNRQLATGIASQKAGLPAHLLRRGIIFFYHAQHSFVSDNLVMLALALLIGKTSRIVASGS